MKTITKAVFPVAGLGTRFLPATKAIPKEMLPIIDKPLIEYAVEEAVNAGITEIIFITSHTKRAIEDHFDQNFELEEKLLNSGKKDFLEKRLSVGSIGKAAFQRSTYATLFAAVGTTYGAGDGASTFNVPNLADNVAMGKSGTKALASTGGANTVSASGTVGGSTANTAISIAQVASHQHDVLGGASAGTPYIRFGRGAGPTTIQTYYSTGGSGGHSHNMSATFSGSATSVLQPYLTVIYIIKT